MVHDKIIPTIHNLALVYDEVYWDDRLDLYNHTPHFAKHVTGVVDTVPIYVQQPQNSFLSKALYNPKYASTIYKIQLGFDFLGRIVVYSGPHLGTQYDGGILCNIYIIYCILFDENNIFGR
jgi:hypothetical protein